MPSDGFRIHYLFERAGEGPAILGAQGKRRRASWNNEAQCESVVG